MAVSYDFTGKRAIVTGGCRGIGRAIATGLAGGGADVWVWDIEPVEVEGVRCVGADISSPDQVAAALAGMEAGTVDILVNDAGYLGPYQPFENFPRGEWQRIIAVNLGGVLEVTRQVLPLMRGAPAGRIVNMGSLAGKEGLSGLAAYSAASAGVIAFTKALSREIADTPIRVNCIAPGPIDTRMIRGLGNHVVDAMISASPLSRLGRPEEVAALALWLCSEEAGFNTGAVFDISGGRARY